MKRADLLERLHHQHEAVEVESGDGRHDVDPAPRTGEVEQVDGGERRDQQHGRYDTGADGGREGGDGEEKAGDGGQRRGDKKDVRDPTWRCAAQHASERDNARHDADEADHDVQQCEVLER